MLVNYRWKETGNWQGLHFGVSMQTWMVKSLIDLESNKQSAKIYFINKNMIHNNYKENQLFTKSLLISTIFWKYHNIRKKKEINRYEKKKKTSTAYIHVYFCKDLLKYRKIHFSNSSVYPRYKGSLIKGNMIN